MIGNEDQLLPVRRKVILQTAAELERRRVELAGREIADLAGGHFGQQDMRALAVLPIGPVAIEQAIGHVGLQLAFTPALGDLLVARVVGAAFGVDVARKRDPFPIGRPQRIAGARRYVGDLARLAAGDRQDVQVRIAVAGTREEDELAVARKHRRRFTFLAKRELARFAAAAVDHPEVAHLLRF